MAAQLHTSQGSSAALQKSQGKNVLRLPQFRLNTCRCTYGKPFASNWSRVQDSKLPGTRQTTLQLCAAVTSPAEISAQASASSDATVSSLCLITCIQLCCCPNCKRLANLPALLRSLRKCSKYMYIHIQVR